MMLDLTCLGFSGLDTYYYKKDTINAAQLLAFQDFGYFGSVCRVLVVLLDIVLVRFEGYWPVC